MVEYDKRNDKLSNLKLSKLKTAVKSNEGTTLRIGSKNFNKQELPHELFLTQKQTTKLRNAKQLSKTKIKKTIMSGGALRSILGRLLPNLIKVASPILKMLLHLWGY